jgi:hypothetical protein
MRLSMRAVDWTHAERADEVARYPRPDKLWDAAKAKADERGETVSEAVRKFLERYSR